jgi:hypothetical protein
MPFNVFYYVEISVLKVKNYVTILNPANSLRSLNVTNYNNFHKPNSSGGKQIVVCCKESNEQVMEENIVTVVKEVSYRLEILH